MNRSLETVEIKMLRKLAVVIVALGSVSVAQAGVIYFDYAGYVRTIDGVTGEPRLLPFQSGDLITGYFGLSSVPGFPATQAIQLDAYLLLRTLLLASLTLDVMNDLF